MPDIVVYPYGPNKPVRIRWQSDTMPTDQDIEDIYASFAKGEVGKPAPSAPVNTGRVGDPNATRIGPEPRSSGTSNDWEHLSSFAGVHGLTVTGKNEKQGHNVNSPHYIGQAIDVRVRDKSPEEIAAFIKAAQAKGIRVVDERTRPNGQAVWTGPHLHLEIGDRNAFFGQQGTPQAQPTPKQAVTNPNIVRDRPAPKGIGFTPQDYPASKVPVPKKPNVPNQKLPVNPDLPPSAAQQFGQPNVAQQFQKSIDIKTPEGKANAKKAYKDQPSKLTVPTKGKATVQVQGNASGSFTIPGIGPVRWVQRGPGFVADVPGLGTVMAPDPQSLAKKIHQGFVDVSLKAKTPAASPNYIGSEQQSQDFYTNQNQNLTAEERASAKARQARATAKDPMRMSLTNPASIIMGAGEHIPGMVATSAGPVLAMLGGATPEEMQFLARRQTVKQADANVAAQMVKYLIPGTMNTQWTADIAKGVVRSLDDLGKGKWETALTEIAGQAGLPAALHGLRYIKPLIGAWKKFRSGEGSLDAFIAATDKMGLDANRKAAVIDAIKSDPNLGFKGFTPEGKPIFSVKSDVGPVEQVAKVDHATEIAAKKAELDARRAARKAETEGPLRQGQGIKVNGQQAEVVEQSGDTVTIRYQDGQVRKVKKSNLNAKPEPTPEVTTQPVPTEPKPVSEPSVTAPKATKEPVQNVIGGVKEPWQMTQEELAKKQMEADNAPSQASGLYRDNIDGLNKQIDDHLAALSDGKILERNRRTGETLNQTRARVQQSLDYLNRNGHKAAVESALKEGKPVPPEVLADYPDLATKYKQPTPNTPKPVEAPQKPVQAAEAGNVKGEPKGMDGLTRTQRNAINKPVKPELPPVHPKAVEGLNNAIEKMDVDALKQWLHPDNKRLRAMYEEKTGVKLPKTARDTNALLDRLSIVKKSVSEDLAKGLSAEQAQANALSKLVSVNSEIEAVKARRDARLKSTTTKGTKQRGSADFTKDDFNDALELAELYVKKAGLTFEQYAKEMVDYFGDGVKPHLKEIWDTHAPVKAAPKVSAPKVEPNEEDITGVAKQVTGRDPMKGTSKEEMADRGRQIIEKDINAVANAIDAVEKKGVPMTPDEVSAAGYRLRQIENKQSEIRAAIEKTNDSAELANLNNLQQGLELEVERILKATDYSLNVGFHQYGMAAQIAYKPDFSLAALKSRAKGALLGTVEVVPKHIETKLASYASTIDQLRADLEAARKQIGDLIHKGSYKRGTKESNVKRLRQFFGEDGGAYQPMGSKSSKQRGAIYTLPNEERDAMAAMRSLAKQLADEGAGSLDEIVSGIRNEIGKNIPEETIYRMLSDKYRKYLLESDVQRMDANRYLRDIQRAAEFKLRTPLEKAVEATSDILGATARSFQAGWDISAPFIQGRKGLIANPIGWMKSWESQLKALKTGDAVVNERLAEMERHPLYPRFVAAGGDKLMRRPGGVFHAQEEVFGTNFMRLASDTMSNAGPIGKYNPVNLYLKGLEHSDAAFSAFMNDLTWDTFVKFAKANPSDPAFLRDTVANLGIIYGRGTGPVAEAIGRSKMGNYFYAPRYTLSQMQYAGTPIRVMNPGSYETTAGRMQALKTYGTQAVAYGTLVAIAKLNGWDIETDIRSSDFGTVALPGGRRLDIFGKESQAYRLVANIFAGRVTKKNEYEKPSIVTAVKSIGQFASGKLAPGPRLPLDVAFGSFDPDKGATPFTMAEFGKRYLPLWVQQTLQNGDMATIPMAILGQDVSKDQKAKLTPERRAKSHPMELPKIKGKPDPLGRPYDPKAQVNDGDVIKEVQRLGIELKWPDTAEGETEAEYKTRAQKQGDAVRDAIRSQMSASLYKNATVTEKRKLLKSEISATKRTFNKDFNEAEKTRKADERLKQIERELATGRK